MSDTRRNLSDFSLVNRVIKTQINAFIRDLIEFLALILTAFESLTTPISTTEDECAEDNGPPY